MKTTIHVKRLAALISGFLALILLTTQYAHGQINFGSSGLQGISIINPTSIDFGPDGRLYVSEQDGDIYAYTISRVAANNYQVVATEHITAIKQIQNHNDDGTLHNVVKRQITGVLAVGTATTPVLYVSSSDYRIGGGGGGSDNGLCTNSGIVSRLTWNGSGWDKVDLVRGLARSEENHAVNGMQLDSVNNILYLAVGGMTNAGSPSNNFALVVEYVTAAAILSIDLNIIDAMPVLFDATNNADYVYDMPTLDDPTRPNANGIDDPFAPGYDGVDINDPFGGNDGLNMAKWVVGSPVQVYASGFRNPYDVVLTEAGKLYSWDNGPNASWGGHPEYEGTDSVTNRWVNGEPGSTGPGPNDAKVNNMDGLHYITGSGYYGGHPCPTRANPSGSGLFTHDHTDGVGGLYGVFRTAYTGNPDSTLPYDWPPVDSSLANPAESDFQNPGVDDNSLFTVKASTNGMCEYTATNFGGAMQGNLLAASFNENIYRVNLNAAGSINSAADVTSLAFGFGSDPLDVTAQGDFDIFPGTIWAATYGDNAITIFEPQDFGTCIGDYNASIDEDHDGYTNADEYDNNTDPCNGANMPSDFDKTLIGGFKVSDLNDPDDDDDGILDNVDKFAMDANNGTGRPIPFDYPLLNGDPGFGIAGLGFTGLMTNLTDDYLALFKDEDNSDVELIAGGAVGLLTFNNVPAGSALNSRNDLKNGWQFGTVVDINTPPFVLKTEMLGPVFQGNPQGNQFHGIYIGNGDQDNYLYLGVNANNGNPQVEVIIEEGGVATSNMYSLAGIDSAAEFSLFLEINPLAGTVQPKAESGSGITNIGGLITLTGNLLSNIQSSEVMAIGVMAGKDTTDSIFNATWDYIITEFVQSTAFGQWSYVNDGLSCSAQGTPGSCPQARHEASYVQVGDKFILVGGRENGSNVNIYDPVTDSWTIGSSPGFNIHHFQGVAYEGLLYMVGAMTGNFPNETGLPNIWIYDPEMDEWIEGPAMPASRIRGSAGCVVYDDKIYLVGGIINGHLSGWVNWLDVYDPATNTWTALADAPNTRDHFHAAVVNDKLYAVAGRRSGSIGTYDDTEADVDVYDFSTNTWTTLANQIPTQRAGNTVAVLGNELLVIGGEKENGNAKNETEALYVTDGTWRSLDTLNTGRHGTQAIVNNNTVYLASGSKERGGGASKIIVSQEVFAFGTPTAPMLNPVTPGNIVASLTQLSYAYGHVGDSTTQNILISNTGGDQAIIIKDMTFLNGIDIHAYSQYELPYHLSPGSNMQIQVSYTPTNIGALEDELYILHSGTTDTTTVTITGDASGNILVLNTTNYQFPTTGIGASDVESLDLINNNGITLQVDSVEITGTHAAEFSTNLTGGTSVSGGSLFSFDVTFTPADYNPVNRTAQLLVYHTGDNSPVSVDLTGVAGCPLSGTPCDDGHAYTFGDMHDGNCNCVGTVYTSNGGVNCNDFIEQNGLVVIEIESEAPANSTWYEGTDSVNGLVVPAPSGTYYMWDAFCGSPSAYTGCGGVTAASDANAMTYKIFISTPGRYKFAARTWQPSVSGAFDNTNNNDFWAQFPDGTALYKKVNDSTTETAIGANDWVKVYHNQLGGWKWKTTTVDGNPHDIYLDFDTVGTYTVKIGGRSKLFAIDRFVLYRSDNPSGNVGQNAATTNMPPESPRGTCDFTTLYQIPLDYQFASTAFGDSTSSQLELLSIDSNDIVVDSIAFIGADSLDYQTDLTAGTIVTGNTSLFYNITYSPQAGAYSTRNATMVIYHNADNDPILVDLSADVACAAAGTPCDDGNALTSNDVEDGNCNCAGDMPTVAIASPADGAAVPYASFNVQPVVTNWPMGSGSNHFHLIIDGVKINSYYDTIPIVVTGLTPGSHKIKLALATVDHSEIGVADSITVSVCDSAGTSCDDGYLNTVNDTADGNCNCFGTPIIPAYSIHINAGGPSHTTVNGFNFIADDYYLNGGTYSQPTKAIGNTVEDILFQSERYSSNLNYQIPAPFAGDYEVTLYYAEVHSGTYSVGARIFDAYLEGNLVLDDYDIFADAGAQNAVTKTFTVQVTDGTLNFNTQSVVGNAKISAISVIYTGLALTVSPDTNIFQATAVGDNHIAQFTLDNSNNSVVVVDSFEFVGSHPTDFTTNLIKGTNIAANSQQLFNIDFSPLNDNPINRSAQLLIYHSAENSPLVVTLNGTVECPAIGTPCDDGNALTVNDVEDGSCNCAGVGPEISIDDPADNSTISYGDVTIDFTVSEWNIASGGNHIHLYIDGVYDRDIFDTLPELVTGLGAGYHVFRMVLADSAHNEPGPQDSIAITLCQPAGLTCDDGDANTVSDTTDGNCGCAGTPIVPIYSLYINSGGSAYTTADGRNFIADDYYNNGSKYGQPAKTIGNTLDDEIFQYERYHANLSYTIPVPHAGQYEVTFYFAEIYSGSYSVGARVMDVILEGDTVLNNYDVFANVGGQNAVSHTFSINVNDGDINLGAIGVVDNAKINAIGIVYLGGDNLTVSPDIYAFPSVLSGGSDVHTFSVSHTGTNNVTVDSVVFTGTDAADFSTDLVSGTVIQVDSTEDFNITFTPVGSTPPNRSASMFIYHSGDNTPVEITLSGVVACSQVGNSCDDGDPGTTNDTINATCNCVGTPIPPLFTMYINSGGSAYSTSDGRNFIADNYFNNGGLYNQPAKVIGNTTDDPLFQSERFDANLSYSIPVPYNGNYEVTFYFAEIYSGAYSVGGRVMDVILEGDTVLHNYDVFADVGAQNAVAHTFTVNITDGIIDLGAIGIVDNAKINAIGIVLPNGSLTVTPSAFTFPKTAVDSTETHGFVLDNMSGISVTIDSVLIGGSEAVDFSTNLTAGATIASGASLAFDVYFTPDNASPAIRSGSISIYHDGFNNPVVIQVDGEGTCPIVGTTCDDGDIHTINDAYDINCNCVGQLLNYLKQEVSVSAVTTTLSIGSTNASGTWRFYADSTLEATYNSNSVSHNWIGSTSRYFEYYPPNNNFQQVFPYAVWQLQNLSGQLPQEFGSMNTLLKLMLKGNNYSGAIPAEIGNMSGLIQLDLSSNNFSGSIPVELGLLTKLTLIYLHENNLSGPIPTELGNLNLVKTMLLGTNNLSGSIPRSFGNLGAIKTLALNTNNLSGVIPVELSQATTLENFFAHANALNSYEPGAFATQGNLVKLFLQQNNLSTADIDSILFDLVQSLDLPGRATCYVDLRNNIGPSVQGKAWADSLIGLGWTVLHDTVVISTPVSNYLTQEISNSATTTTLSLGTTSGTGTWKFYADSVLEATYNSNSVTHNWTGSSNRYFEYYPPNSDFSLVYPYCIWQYQNLTGNLPAEFGDMTSLLKLLLKGNGLSGSIPTVLGDLSALTHLDLSTNSFAGNIPTELGMLANLTVLYLHENSLAGSIPNDLGNLNKVKTMLLGTNNLTGSIPRTFGNLGDIRTLALNTNSLTGAIPVELSQATTLVNFFAHANALNGYEPGAFATQANMAKLFLYNNNLGQADIDSILFDLAASLNVPGRVTAYIDLRYNTAPSVAGKAMADSLIGLGWTVLHDPLPSPSVAGAGGNSIDIQDLDDNRNGASLSGEDELTTISSETMEIFPNPASGNDNLVINLDVLTPGISLAEIRSIQGQLIYQSQQEVYPGRNEIHIQLDNLTEGSYLLRVVKDEKQFTEIVIISN